MAKSSLEWLQAVTCTRGGHRETKSIQVQSETLSRSDKKGEEANVQEFALLALRTKMNGAEGLFFLSALKKRVTEVIDSQQPATPAGKHHSSNFTEAGKRSRAVLLAKLGDLMRTWQKEKQVRGAASVLCIVGWPVSGLKESSIMSRLSEGSPSGLQFQRVTIELFPSASTPCLIEQTYQCPFVEVSHIRTLSATPQNRPYGI
ncbi:hypothetical protein DPX16_7223 [Anabarilius grahami]|uniref:Uncharacterized protein n=1 Tax=Anabarilius grahami TaxID=495550 RepID=A0A3N0XPJ3_ANAGA|nr:hypothetical protein DPX16_7223 [Anabarilius grahami]